jgi:outer membrane protein assembly factor BamB
MVMPGQNLPVELTEQNTLWTVDLDSKWCYSQPAVVGDRIIFGMDGTLTMPYNDDEITTEQGQVRCLDLHTGEMHWLLSLGASGYGPCATFTIEGDRIYFVHETNLFCLDLHGQENGNQGFQDEVKYVKQINTNKEDYAPTALPDVPYGDILWVLDLKQHGVDQHDASSGTPLIIGDYIAVSTSHSLGARPSSAHSKNPEDYAEQQERWLKGGLDTKKVPNIVVAHKDTGKLVAWDRQNIPEVYHSQWGSIAGGMVNGEPMIFWGDGYGFMHAFRVPEIPENHEGEPLDLEHVWFADGNPREYRYAEDGTERPYPHTMWKSEDLVRRKTGPSHFISTPVFHEGKIYGIIGRDLVYNHKYRGLGLGGGALTCFDPTGEGDVTETHIVWQNTEVGRSQSTPSIKDGILYVGSLDGHLYCVDIQDGSILSKVDLEHSILERSQMLTDGKIYVGTHSGSMAVFSEGPEPELLWEGRLRSPTTTPTPVGDMLLIGTHRNLHCFKKAAGPAPEPDEEDVTQADGSH